MGNFPLDETGEVPPFICSMEEFIRNIETFAAEHGITPQKLLRDAMNAEWGRWALWKAGDASPTMITADKVRAYMKNFRAARNDVAEDAA